MGKKIKDVGEETQEVAVEISEEKSGWIIKGEPVSGRIFDTQVRGVLGEDNVWEVTFFNRESITTDGENWEGETVAFKSYDDSFDNAHKTVLQAYLAWMQDNVYNKGFDSLILAVRDLEKVEESADGNDNKADETP